MKNLLALTFITAILLGIFLVFYLAGERNGRIDQLVQDQQPSRSNATKPVWQCIYGCGNPTQSNVQIWRSYCTTEGSGQNLDGTLYCFEEKKNQ